MTACVGDNRVNETLQTADRLIFVAQDSAVIMLDNLDLDHASRAQRARHALLLTKAREKANITVTDDSLIAIAADYYRGCGDSLEVQSLFYHGVILGYRDDYPRALLSLIQAADLADAIGDDFYRAMACREQVGVYTKLYEFDRAARLGEEAVRAFNRAGRPLHAAWERVFIPQSLLYSGNINAACDSIAVLATDSLIQSDPHLRQEFLHIATNVYFEKHDFEQSESYFDAYIDEGDAPSSKMLSQMAELVLAKGDITKAKHYYDLAIAAQQNATDSLTALSVLSQIYEAEGDFKNAHLLNVAAQNAATNSTNDLITHPYTAVLNDYFHSEIGRQSLLLDEVWLRTIIWILIVAILSAVIIALIILYRRNMRRRADEKDILSDAINRLESQISVLSSRQNALSSEKKYSMALINSICEARTNMLSTDDNLHRFGKNVSDIMFSLTDRKNLSALEDLINGAYDNLMDRFISQVPGITDKERTVAIFVFLGYSNTSISAIMQYKSSTNVRQLRHKIKTKILADPSVDNTIFLRYFDYNNR